MLGRLVWGQAGRRRGARCGNSRCMCKESMIWRKYMHACQSCVAGQRWGVHGSAGSCSRKGCAGLGILATRTTGRVRTLSASMPVRALHPHEQLDANSRPRSTQAPPALPPMRPNRYRSRGQHHPTADTVPTRLHRFNGLLASTPQPNTAALPHTAPLEPGLPAECHSPGTHVPSRAGWHQKL